MRVRFKDPDLDRLETDPRFTANLAQGVVKAYRELMQLIRAARDERDFYSMSFGQFEKLKADLAGRYSFRLNKQFRLIVEFEGDAPNKTVVVVAVEDYH